MTAEQLDEIKQLAEARLRVGDLLASHCLLLHSELMAAMDENARLRAALQPTRHDLETCCCPDCCTLRQVTGERDDARKRMAMFKEFIDDYKETVAEHEETIRYWQSEAHRIERERRAALAEIDRLREATKHSFTMDQITETMQKAIGVCTGYSPPTPRPQHTLRKRPPTCPLCRCNAVYISAAASDSLLPELRPMECLKCKHKWTGFFESDGE